MMTTFVILFLQLLVFHHSHCKKICRSEVCKQEASNMLESMDNTIDPCEDFYEFACRGWLTKNPIPKKEVSWDHKEVITRIILDNIYNILNSKVKKKKRRPIKLARTFYRSCMDLEALEVDGLDSVHNALKKVGLPLIPPVDDEAENYDLGKIAGLARRYYGIDIFFKMGIRHHPRNNAITFVSMSKPELLLENLEGSFQDPVHWKYVIDTTRLYIKEMIKLTGVENEVDYYTTELMDFLTAVSKVMGIKQATSFRGTIPEFQAMSNAFTTKWNWTSYLNGVFEETDVTIETNGERILFNDGTYFVELNKLLRRTPTTTLVRAAYFSVFLPIAAQATYEGVQLNNEFTEKIYGSNSRARWLKCLELVNKHFDKAVIAAYIEIHFSVKQKKKALEMWNDVRSSFEEMLDELPWMDSLTKSEAHKKLNAMKYFIAYPDWLADPKKLDKYYEEYDADEVRLFKNIALATAIEIRKELNGFRQIPDKNQWPITPLKVKVVYAPNLNTIILPVGILHLPFFGDGIDALNYGGIGATLGHEITHGFDSRGWRLNGGGNYRMWYTNKTFEKFAENVQCMMNQYGEFVVTQLGSKVKVDGEATYVENIADNGGLREAFRAYKKLKERNKEQQALPGLVKYSDEQLFFIGYAQARCSGDSISYLKAMMRRPIFPPFHYRVIGTLQNNVDFAKAFNCRLGSRMNPPTKCVTW